MRLGKDAPVYILAAVAVALAATIVGLGVGKVGAALLVAGYCILAVTSSTLGLR